MRDNCLHTHWLERGAVVQQHEDFLWPISSLIRDTSADLHYQAYMPHLQQASMATPIVLVKSSLDKDCFGNHWRPAFRDSGRDELKIFQPPEMDVAKALTAVPGSESLRAVAYFAKTLYLFTVSDHLTFIVPQAMYGIVGALSGPALTGAVQLSTTEVLRRVPAVFFWTWLHTLVFTMHNQSSHEAVLEDKMNKPFRPIAAGRISIERTKALLWMLIPLTFACALALGGVPETIFLLVGNFMYNEGRGSDKNILVRNWSIATAFALYGSGALEVAAGGFSLGRGGAQWTFLVACVIMTTMHIQDLKDQTGDAMRGRRTVPLVYGDSTARWTIIGPVVFWTALTAWYWPTLLLFHLAPVVLGAIVCVRLLAFRDTRADRRTWKIWSIWLLSLYFLPLMHSSA